VRQRQAIEGQQHGAGRRHLEDGDACRHTGNANKYPRRNPADSAEYANHREGFIDVCQAVKRNVVSQRKGWHVAERVAKQQADQQHTVFSNQRARHKPQDRRPGEMHHRHDLLRGKEAIHQHAKHKRRQNRGDWPGGERITNQ